MNAFIVTVKFFDGNYSCSKKVLQIKVKGVKAHIIAIVNEHSGTFKKNVVIRNQNLELKFIIVLNYTALIIYYTSLIIQLIFFSLSFKRLLL